MKKEVRIDIDPDKIESKYSDLAIINVNPFGFTLDFGQNVASLELVKVVARVSLSPQHAKIFSDILAQNIREYERKFGEIKVNPQMKEELPQKKIGFNYQEEDK